MSKTWVVVADEAIARFLAWPDEGDELQSVEEMTDPDAHASGSDLQRDAHGRRSNSSAPQGSRQNSVHALRGPSTSTTSSGLDEQHQEAEEFARNVARKLDEAYQQHRFEELRIVAAPRFLGLLRKQLSKNVAQAVSEELDKDLIKASNRELTERLFH